MKNLREKEGQGREQRRKKSTKGVTKESDNKLAPL